MKRFRVLLILLIFVPLISLAKKDINAWKSERNLDQQYTVFKENLNYWNGSYFLKEFQLNDFYNALNDSVATLEKDLTDRKNQIASLQKELNSTIRQSDEIQIKLDESIKRQNSIGVFGKNINKHVYSLTMYIFILGVLALCGMVFLMFKRSNKIAHKWKNDFNELKQEFELYKKNSLERYTKINTELHKTRMEMRKR